MENTAINQTEAHASLPRFTVTRADLYPVLDLMARHIVERRSSIPILDNVRIDASPAGELHIIATDLDAELRATIKADVETPGQTTLPSHLLRDIVKKAAANASIHFQPHDGRMKVNHGSAGQILQSLPVDDFPAIQEMKPATLSAEFDAPTFAADLALVSPAISKEESRYYLNGINFSIEGDLFCMAATDGHRLSLIERDAAPIVAMDFAPAILPRKIVAVLGVILKGTQAATVSMDMNASKALFTIGNLTLYTKLIDGTFPDYRRVIPSADKLRATLSVESKELMEHCAPIDGRKGSSCALQVEASAGALRAGQSGKSGYARALSGEFNGPDCAFAFNAIYISHFAKLHDRLDIQSVSFDGEEAGAPMLIKSPSAPQWTGVLMPMRCDDSLPEAQAVIYPDVKPAPGRAADLFGIEATRRVNVNGSYSYLIGIEPGPRSATNAECEAYARDYAARCGLDVADLDFDYKRNADGQMIAATFGEYVTVILPGYIQPAVTLELMGDDGEYGAPMACTDAKGRIALPDQPKGRAKAKPRTSKSAKIAAKAIAPADIAAPDATPISEAAPDAPLSGEYEPSYRALPSGEYETTDSGGNVWLHKRDGSQELVHDETGDAMAKAIAHAKIMQEAAAAFEAEFMPALGVPETLSDAIPAPDIASDAEIAPSEAEIAVPDDIEAQPETVAALIARLERLESIMASASTAKPEPEHHPFVGILEPAPISGKAERSPAHIRAIMAYLAMRKARNAERTQNSIGMGQLDAMRKDRDDWQAIAEENTRKLDDAQRKVESLTEEAAYQERKKIQYKDALEAMTKNRDEMHERFHNAECRLNSMVKRAERADAAEKELAILKQKIADPANPVRQSDMHLLKTNAEAWETKAKAAIEEGERLKRLVLANAGHIETLASRIARAEAMLREQGNLPTIKLVPPVAMAG